MATEVYWEEAWACQGGKAPLLGGTGGERRDNHKKSFPCECSQKTTLPTGAAGMGVSHPHRHLGLQRQALAASSRQAEARPHPC